SAIDAGSYAILKSSGFSSMRTLAANQLSQFRMVLDQRLKQLRIAVHQTGVVVTFRRTGKSVVVEPGHELVVKLIGPSGVGALTTRDAKFTDAELAVFARQG